MIEAGPVVAYSRAAATISPAGIPVISDAPSGGKPRTCSRSSSNPRVCSDTKASSKSRSSMMTRAMALKRAVSEPTRSRSQRVAKDVSSMRRGSTTMRRAPRRTAALTRIERTGWDSVVLVPTARMSFASSRSAMLLLIAPRPTMIARPATVGACQVRAQLSTLFVPTPARASL